VSEPASPSKPAATAVTEVNGQPVFRLKIWAPFRVYYDDLASSLSGTNETGPFDVLAHHKNFMSILNASELVVQAPRGEQRIKIARGVLYVRADQVTVFLDV
jgi:F0F1-type ATP synthase epsilon subunit